MTVAQQIVFRQLPLVIAIILGGTISTAAESLTSAVQTALTTNPRIRSADADVRASAFDLLRNEGEYQPIVSLFGDVGTEFVNDPAGLSPADNTRWKGTGEIGVVAELILFDGYRRANQVYADAARLDRSTFELLDASETMALTVAEAYIDIIRQREVLRVAQEQLARYGEIAEQVQNQVDGGRLPISDQLTAQNRINRAQVAITAIERALRESEAKYRKLVGRGPSGSMRYPTAPKIPGSLDNLIEASIKNNFRIKSADANVRIRDHQRDIADAQFLPRVSLNAGGSYGENLDGQSGEENRAFLGLNMSWQLYNGGRESQLRAFDERKNAAIYDRLSIVREVVEFAERSWAAYQLTSQNANLLSLQTKLNADIVAQYDAEFQLATRSLLDLLSAETDLFSSRFAFINAVASLTFSRYQLLATQSRLAAHFGVKSSETLLGLTVGPTEGERPLDVIRKGRPLVQR